MFVCTHDCGSIVWSLWWLRCCGNDSCNCDGPQNYFAPHPPTLPHVHRFVTVSSLSCFPSFLPPLSSLPHCFLLSPPSVSPTTPLRCRHTLTCSRRAIYITGSAGRNLKERTCSVYLCFSCWGFVSSCWAALFLHLYIHTRKEFPCGKRRCFIQYKDVMNDFLHAERQSGKCLFKHLKMFTFQQNFSRF